MKTKLTFTQICEAFPEEIKTLVPQLAKDANPILKWWDDYLDELQAKKYDKWTKEFLVLMVKYCYYPINALNRKEKCMAIQKYNKNWKSGKVPEITEEDIKRANDVPIESLYNFEKVRTGRERITARCPLHTDKLPSFVIYREKNSFHCFSCKAGRSAIDFYMLINNCKFKEAVKCLRK